MEKIAISIDVNDNIDIVAGLELGKDSYRKNRHLIDVECMNVISFPSHVNRIISSFLTGFFEELRKNMTLGEISEHFSFDESMQCYESALQAFSKI